MSPFAAFRVSVVAEPVIGMMAIAYTLMAKSGLSQDWQDLLAWSGDGGHIFVGDTLTAGNLTVMIFTIVFLLVVLGNQIGLYFYWRPSRSIYLTTTVVGLLATPLLGLTVAPPLEAFGSELSSLSSGITLALLFFSPVAERFSGVQ